MRTLPWFRGPQIYLALLRHLGTAEFWRPSSCKQDLALGPQWVLFHTCERKRAASDYTEVPVECVPELVQRTIASTGIILQYPNMVTIPDTEMKQVMANATGTPSVAVCIEGLFQRTTPLQLARMAAALRSLGKDYQVVSVLSSGQDKGNCKLSMKTLRRAFGLRMRSLRCVVDPPDQYRHFKLEFLRSMPNSENRSWWKENFRHLWTHRFADGVTMAGHVQSWTMKQMCLQEIVKLERRLPVPVDWVIYLRADLDFLASHPPITLMASMGPGRIWIPDVMDWGGLNDRWAVMSRDVAPIYLGRIRDLIGGNILPAIQRDFAVTNSSPVFNTTEHSVNAERLLRYQSPATAILGRRGPETLHRFGSRRDDKGHCTAMPTRSGFCAPNGFSLLSAHPVGGTRPSSVMPMLLLAAYNVAGEPGTLSKELLQGESWAWFTRLPQQCLELFSLLPSKLDAVHSGFQRSPRTA